MRSCELCNVYLTELRDPNVDGERGGVVLSRTLGWVCITFIYTHSTEQRMNADLQLFLGLGLFAS